MDELKYTPVPHDTRAFLDKARARNGFSEALRRSGAGISSRGPNAEGSVSCWSHPRCSRQAHGHDQERYLPPRISKQARSVTRNAQTLCERCRVRTSSKTSATEGDVTPRSTIQTDNYRRVIVP